MIQKRKRKLTPKQLSTVIASLVLVFLIAAYASISAILGAIEASDGSGEGALPEIYEEIGESLYAGYPIAYPQFTESAVQTLDVRYYDEDGKEQFFSVRRPNKDSDFIFYYTDTDNNLEVYLPPITGAEDDFDYSSLYGTDSSSGYNIYKLTYMMVAIGTLYFDERMPLSAEGAERERQLNRYGLGEEERKSVAVSYLDKDGKTVQHTVHIGDLAIDGSGYYFTVEGRDYIYNSLSTNFSYILNGFVSLVSSRLIAEGLIEDKTWEPYFTTDLKQWKNTLHNTEGDIIPTDSNSVVIFTGNSILPLFDADLLTDIENGGNGYSVSGKKQITVRLDSLTPATVNAVLRGAAIKDSAWIPVTVTEVSNANFATDGATYTYTIKAIEGHFTDSADIYDRAVPVGDSRYVKVTYDYTVTVDDKTSSYTSAHAVLDMQNLNTGIPESVITAIKGMTVGALSEPITFSTVYTEENADKTTVKFVVKDILEIYELDEDGKPVEAKVISEKSIVTYSYALMSGDKELESSSGMVDLGKIAADNEINNAIKTAIIGKSVGLQQNIEAYEGSLLLQSFMDYVSYTVDSVDYFVTEEIVTSLEFVNASDRNPFFGESLYKNTLTGGYSLYALDSTASEAIMRLLGGINLDSSSTISPGLVGSETVAVGLTPANMMKYGLYANTLYFEMPRGIKTLESGSSSDIDDYYFLDTLGFTLYISDEQPDGSRYIGSDMYDIVAKVKDARWVFLDMSFVDYWARKTLAAVSYSDIEKMDVKFYMDDVYGSYTFNLDHNEVYIYNGELYNEMPEQGGQLYDQLTVNVSMGSHASDTLLKQMLTASGASATTLCKVYQKAMNSKEIPWAVYDSLGTENFKTMLSVVFNTYYTGTFSDLSKEEMKTLKDNGKLMMSFSFDIKGQAYSYVYDFYRIDDRRFMVSLYEESPSGQRTSEVYDFYVSTFTFKKIARSFLSLLNGQVIDENEGYPAK